MKGFIKSIATVAAVLFVIGLGAIIFGFATGGEFVDVPLGNTGYNILTLNKLNWFRHKDNNYQDNVVNDGSNEKTYTVPKEQEIDSLDFEIGDAAIEIISGNEYKFESEGKREYSNKVVGNTWRIETFGKRFPSNKNEKITITIPKDASFTKVEFSIGAGVLDVENIVTDELDIEVGAGVLEGSGFNVSSKTNISCGAANVEISGIFNGKNDYECGVGRLIVNLDEMPTDYGYNVEAALGNAKIFDKTFTGLADAQQNKGADTFFDVQCGLGNLEINYGG